MSACCQVHSVYPTSCGAQHTGLEWLIAPGKPLDPTKYFIMIVNKFGNGMSSSPSNTPPPFDRGRYPHFTRKAGCIADIPRLRRGCGAKDRPFGRLGMVNRSPRAAARVEPIS
jgi:hypothetical protein